MKTKDIQRQEIAAHVRDYLKRGGKITHVPHGASGVVIDLPQRRSKSDQE